MGGSHSGFEDLESLVDVEEVENDLLEYHEVEEGMGMWEVFCEMIGQDLEEDQTITDTL